MSFSLLKGVLYNIPPIVLDQIFLLGWYLRASATCCSHIFKCNSILHKQDVITSWVQWWDSGLPWLIFVNVRMLTWHESFWNFCVRDHCKCLCKVYFQVLHILVLLFRRPQCDIRIWICLQPSQWYWHRCSLDNTLTITAFLTIQHVVFHDSIPVFNQELIFRAMSSYAIILMIFHMPRFLHGLRETVFEQSTQLIDNW